MCKVCRQCGFLQPNIHEPGNPRDVWADLVLQNFCFMPIDHFILWRDVLKLSDNFRGVISFRPKIFILWQSSETRQIVKSFTGWASYWEISCKLRKFQGKLGGTSGILFKVRHHLPKSRLLYLFPYSVLLMHFHNLFCLSTSVKSYNQGITKCLKWRKTVSNMT